ncbi:hypothetical protein A2841_00490 [Candidatus Kaiserbacteria bacterium RIFCSPHIGHO2_01_FULL_48_10]|uniref:Uncharacterized protein n=1 Tax=Candidatus Kaiserbacteria bacterium RIFCSPHIGHO2_01_FULL_48_10 TaxID=1798476 RepID=A0A1F6C5K0_9BACT|nr:MAG: hypothetical protein A2841_00490 [Candidatus Kaiserbacteria bacterium RIFCSPHIGHO2_01_FULL_48_10]
MQIKNLGATIIIVVVSIVGTVVNIFLVTGFGFDSGEWICSTNSTIYLQNAVILGAIIFDVMILYFLWERPLLQESKPVAKYILGTIGFFILVGVIGKLIVAVSC